MSRIGKVPVAIPEGVEVNLNGNEVNVAGKLGTLKNAFPKEVKIIMENGQLQVKPVDDSTRAKAMWGLSRSLLNNMVVGVSVGFKIRLEINGVGYNAAIDNKILTIKIGYSHSIKILIPDTVTVRCEKPTLIELEGADKKVVGEIARTIKSQRKLDPYKGKGIKFEGEKIRRKVGKKK